MATRMQQRRGTAAQWISLNDGDGPILASGEIGFETDTNQFKIGDGINHWADLSYFKNLEDLGGSLDDYILLTAKGAASGVAELDASSNILAPVGIVFEGATANSYETTIQVQDPTEDRNITFPNATGIVVLSDSSGNVTIPGNFTVSGTTTTVDSTVINIQNELKFEGATANAYETSVVAEDPTADRTITLPNLTGTVVLHEGAQSLFNKSINLNSNTLLGTIAEFNTAVSDADLATLAGTETLTNKTLTSPKINENVAVTATATELNYVDGVTSAIQTQLDAKLSSATASTTYQPLVSGVSDTEIGYLDGVTSAIQTQLNAKLASSTASTTYAPIASPTFTGTVSGITKAMVSLENVDNTSDANKPVSTATQTALDLKSALSGPTFTGTVVLPSTTSIGTVSNTEIGYLDGVTGAIQTQLNNKQSVISGVSDVEIGYLDGVTSAIQTQMDAKAPLASPTFTGTVTLPANTISQSMMGDDSVGTNEIGGLAVTEEKIAALAVTEGKIADSAVTSAKIANGTIVNADINASAAIATSKIDGLDTALSAKAPLASPTFTGTVTLPGAPTLDLHAATKLYVDNVVAGLNFHQPVRVATTANITLSGTQTIDGVSLSVGDRVLVKDQTTATQNGIYVVAASTWSRATDADNTPDGELKGGDFTLVLEGTAGSGYGYVCSNTSAITIGTTNVTYAAFNAAKAVVAGNGLSEATPGTLSIDTSITATKASVDLKAPIDAPTFTNLVTVAASGIAFTDGTQAKEGVPSRTPIIQKTASYTLSALTERDSLIEVSSASGTTITIPTNTAVAYPVGTSIDILQTGAGQITIAPVDGTVTVNATPGLKLRTQWSSCTLFKRATNTWVVYGDLTA
jgi:hypothetical protein